MSTTITQADVREAFQYDPDTGEFCWRNRSAEHFKTRAAWKAFNTKYAGKPFGRVGKTGSGLYRQGMFMGKYQFAHRLIYLYAHGYFPNLVDHIDGNGMNNRLSNIRDVSSLENARNMARNKRNTSGVTGVHWSDQYHKKWMAGITIHGRLEYLGRFYTKEEAIRARKAAERRYGFHENHGRNSTQSRGIHHA